MDIYKVIQTEWTNFMTRFSSIIMEWVSDHSKEEFSSKFAKTNTVVMVQYAFQKQFKINPPSPKNIQW